MTIATIDHGTLSRLVETGAVRAAHVVGGLGGWKIVVHADKDFTYTLAVQRQGRSPRLFKKMDTLIGYLKDVGIAQFDVDATLYQPESYSRPDRSVALRRTHAAASHDKWFREQVDEAVRAADAPGAVWISHDDARQDWADLRADLLERLKTDGHGA